MNTIGYTRDLQPTDAELAAMPLADRHHAFLESTATFYHSGNRGVDGNCCCYYPTPTSPGCPIGRWMTPENARRAPINALCNDPIVIDLMPPWMQEMDPWFRAEVQELHDSRFNWYACGLNDNGKANHQTILLGLLKRFPLDVGARLP